MLPWSREQLCYQSTSYQTPRRITLEKNNPSSSRTFLNFDAKKLPFSLPALKTLAKETNGGCHKELVATSLDDIEGKPLGSSQFTIGLLHQLLEFGMFG